MKKVAFTIVMFLTLSLFTYANKVVATGQSYSQFGNYKIEQLDEHMMLNNKELDKYLITYEKSAIQVVVAVDKQKKCKKYYVLTDKIPIQYECNGEYFGIKQLDKALMSQGYKTTMNQLDKGEYYHQKVLVSGMTATMDHLQLIASYYPGLFNGKAA